MHLFKSFNTPKCVYTMEMFHYARDLHLLMVVSDDPLNWETYVHTTENRVAFV